MAGVRSTRRSSGKFQGWFIDHTGKQKFFEGTRNRAETARIAQRLEDEHRQIRLGYIPLKTSARKTLAAATDEYLAWGKAQGGRDGRPWGQTHLRNRRSQLAWWCGQLGDTLEAIRLASVETLIRGLQAERTPKTVANYAETIAAFCDWCVERGFLSTDPLQGLGRLDTTPKSHRRAMTVEEIGRLLSVCAPHVRLLLETAFLTGLRANELRNLTIEHLDGKRGGLILDAAWTKNRKPGFQPLPAFLVERLQTFAGEAAILYEKIYKRHGAKGAAITNPLLYVPSHPARSLDIELEKASIQKVTPEGKIDFHAVRLAYINLVIESGVTVKEAQVLARHATPQMTMNVYGRVRDERLWHVVEQIAEHVQYMSSEHGHAGTQATKEPYTNNLEEQDACKEVGSIPAASIFAEQHRNGTFTAKPQPDT